MIESQKKDPALEKLDDLIEGNASIKEQLILNDESESDRDYRRNQNKKKDEKESLFSKLLKGLGGGLSGLLKMIPGGGMVLAGLSKLFGKGGILGNLLKNTIGLKNLAKLKKFGGRAAGALGGAALAGSLAADDYEKGEKYFQEGRIGRGVATTAFGETDKDASGLEIAGNVGKQALKWGGLGASIGSVVPGIGTAIGGAVGALS